MWLKVVNCLCDVCRITKQPHSLNSFISEMWPLNDSNSQYSHQKEQMVQIYCLQLQRAAKHPSLSNKAKIKKTNTGTTEVSLHQKMPEDTFIEGFMDTQNDNGVFGVWFTN